MSRLFYAVNRETGERWKNDSNLCEGGAFLVLYDSGYAAVVSSDGWYTHISPLCNKTWKIIFNDSMQNKIDRSLDKTNQ
jgi:hypothetical protein